MSNTCFASPMIDDVEDITPEDRKCFEEIRKILVKHGKEKKFGVTLLHQHFPINPGEVMLETNDPKTRTLLMRPVKESDIGNTPYRETQWRLDTGQISMACVCVTDYNGNHAHIPKR